MKWKVYNTHPDGLTHREKFRDDMIEIKAGGFILMDYEDAVIFKGQYFPMRMDAMGQPDRTTFKCIKLEPEHAGEVQAQTSKTYVCHIDGREFSTKEELQAYTSAKYSELETVKDAAIDKQIEDQIIQEKKRTGRPPKEKTA